MGLFSTTAVLPTPESALPGRDEAMPLTNQHYVNGNPIQEPFPDGLEVAVFGLGCFWGAERCFWKLDGVYATAVGYAGGYTPNPTYQEVCAGQTGHNEVVRVIYDPARINYEGLLKVFWDSHDPTQGMRQGNDAGTQYRSGIYTAGDVQQSAALQSREKFQSLSPGNHPASVRPEIFPATAKQHFAAHHQRYRYPNDTVCPHHYPDAYPG